MAQSLFPVSHDAHQWWTRVLTSVIQEQWKVLDSQYLLGIRLLDVLRSRPEVQRQPDLSSPAGNVEQRARERLRKGFAPPREIYDVQNRQQFDWLAVPDWARPSDPELFEGTHEG
jgi:hypothetical protein